MAAFLNGLYLFFLVIVSPWIVWRSWKHGRFRRGWIDKFFGPSQAPPTARTVVWLHAVSVGEVQVLRTLVETLESERPDLNLAISVTTDSGMDLATKLFPKHFLFFTPFDFTWSIKKTFRKVQPKLIVLAELELWPNWLLHAEKAGCPVAVINGRLSERSFNGYSQIPYLVRKCMQTIDWVGAQSQSYAARFEKLGLPSSRLTVTGNVKFDGATGNRFASEVISRKEILGMTSEPTALAAVCDFEPTALAAVCDSSDAANTPLKPEASAGSQKPEASACGWADENTSPTRKREGRNHPSLARRACIETVSSTIGCDVIRPAYGSGQNQMVFLAGSTQAPEELIVLNAFLELADRFPNLKLILVPRHAERFCEVAKMIAATGLPWAKRSASRTLVTDANWRIFLGDSVGELRWWWGLADVGFVGGSFGDRGGQNMIEPCAYGVATCFGPNTRNFSDIVKILLDEQACEQLQTPEQLRPWLESMLTDTAKRERMSAQAMQVSQNHRGASQRTWENLQRLLPSKIECEREVSAVIQRTLASYGK